MFIEAARKTDLAPGGMISVKLNGTELVLCRDGHSFYAVGRKCGHAGVHLERGTLSGRILTCPLHCAQFDISTGAALSGPVPEAPHSVYPDPSDPALETHGLKTYPVQTTGDSILVELP